VHKLRRSHEDGSTTDLYIPQEWLNNNQKDKSDSIEVKGKQKNKAEFPTLPDHLQELFEKSCENIPDIQTREKLAEVLIKNKQAFASSKTDVGTCSVLKHRIDTAGGAPVRQPLRRTPVAFEKEELQYLQDQLKNGVIKPSESAWASPVVLVRKKDNSVRWCVDYRKVNDLTIKDAYPIPRIDMCLDCLASASIFSCLDLQSGYWQLLVDERDRPKTAFITKYGLYEYNKMPFGLCNAPSTFQRCMELIFRGLQWQTLLIYLDDIIIFSSDLDEHLLRLDEVLKRIVQAGLKLKPSKCDLVSEEILYLGHVVGKDGIKPNPKIIKSVQDWKKPTSTKEVQQFLGLCNYYRQYIRNFSDIASPLSHLTRKDVAFTWTEACDESFNRLKEALISPPVLAYPCPVGTYILDTDASNIGIGGMLSQVQDGREKIISFASKKLDKVQQRYSVTRRELLAAVTFMHQFRHYLLGQKFLLRTDHGSLRWLFGFKDPTGQLARWIESLSQFNFEIQHRPGVKHANADAMSRTPGQICQHQNEGRSDQDCKECQEIQEEWEEFHTDIDTVKDLSTQQHDHKDLGNGDNLHKPRIGAVSEENRYAPKPWLSKYTSKEISTFQKEDPDYKHLHQWFDDGKVPDRDFCASLSPATRRYWLNWDNLVRKDGVIYQKWKNNTNNQEHFQLLVPFILRKEVLIGSHNTVYAGHMGIKKTKEKMKTTYTWYKMGQDVKMHIDYCEICRKLKDKGGKPKAPLVDYRVGNPLDRIAIDIIGPLPQSKKKNQYLLVVGDYFTRWMEAYPLPHQRADIIAHKLVMECIARFGIPLELHSDQGSNFQSDLFKSVCSLLEITKTRTTPYHPSSNGLIERFNRTLLGMIKSFINSNGTDWDSHINLLLSAYRSTPHPATGFTPNFMMLGREINMPLQFLHPTPTEHRDQATDKYAIELYNKLQEAYQLARRHLQTNAERMKRDHDTRLSRHSYKLGDLVLKFDKTIQQKFKSPWTGPHLVTKVLSPVVFEICLSVQSRDNSL